MRGGGEARVWVNDASEGVCAPALELPLAWEGPQSARWRAEPRSEPDSGNPTVRDRRGALRNVIHGEPRNPLRNRKSGTGHSSPTGARAQFLSRHPHAAFDVAGAGNGVTVGSTRARTGKPGTQTRPRPHGPPRQPSTLPGINSFQNVASVPGCSGHFTDEI